MSEFTNGRWVAAPLADGEDDMPRQIVLEGDTQLIAEVCGRSDKEIRGNLALVVSAPALYEAAKHLRDVHRRAEAHPLSVPEEEWRDADAWLDEVIARAEGRDA